jgi:hypothetical protein
LTPGELDSDVRVLRGQDLQRRRAPHARSTPERDIVWDSEQESDRRATWVRGSVRRRRHPYATRGATAALAVMRRVNGVTGAGEVCFPAKRLPRMCRPVVALERRRAGCAALRSRRGVSPTASAASGRTLSGMPKIGWGRRESPRKAVGDIGPDRASAAPTDGSQLTVSTRPNHCRALASSGHTAAPHTHMSLVSMLFQMRSAWSDMSFGSRS